MVHQAALLDWVAVGTHCQRAPQFSVLAGMLERHLQPGLLGCLWDAEDLTELIQEAEDGGVGGCPDGEGQLRAGQNRLEAAQAQCRGKEKQLRVGRQYTCHTENRDARLAPTYLE